MDYQPLVSIIMPAYNCEKYITQAVRSVKEQTYQNWELIIIEDCSSDRTWEIVQNFANENIFVYRNEKNVGVAQTRNRGVELAKTDWIAFLDSDDIWTPDKLEKQIGLLNQEKNALMFFTASAFMTESGERLKYVLHIPKIITQKQLLKQNLISCSSVLVKKQLVQQHPFPVGILIHEDFAVWLEILKEVPFAFGLDEPLLIYRLSSTSKSGNKLKAAKMNWNTYHYVGQNPLNAAYNMLWYTLNGIKKYWRIEKTKHESVLYQSTV